MNEEDVRALVREAIERHLGRPGQARLEPRPGSYPQVSPGSYPGGLQGSYPSHALLKVLPGSDVDEGACVIEPAVRCNHCGFCQSYGH